VLAALDISNIRTLKVKVALHIHHLSVVAAEIFKQKARSESFVQIADWLVKQNKDPPLGTSHKE